jgi:GDP-L-fucose synthase
MHASDLARACVWALFQYDDDEPLIVAGEEVSVRRAAELVCQATGFTGGLAFDVNAVDGPLRRTADVSKFTTLCPDFQFRPLLDGIKDTVAWYKAAHGGGHATAVADVHVARPKVELADEGGTTMARTVA